MFTWRKINSNHCIEYWRLSCHSPEFHPVQPANHFEFRSTIIHALRSLSDIRSAILQNVIEINVLIEHLLDEFNLVVIGDFDFNIEIMDHGGSDKGIIRG